MTEFTNKEYIFGKFDDDTHFDDDVLSEINFSQIVGKNFRKSFSNVKSKIKNAQAIKKVTPKKPLTQNIPVRDRATVHGDSVRKLGKVIVPADQKVIIEHVNKFILDDKLPDVKRINYNGDEKLKEVVLVYNNNTSDVDFTLEMFNPSMALDFLQATSLNINDQVKISDGTAVSYTDVLFNILANPLLVFNAKIVIAGPQDSAQINEPLTFINKNTAGVEKIHPVAVGLHIDNYQYERSNINFFNIHKKLNRPFIADGMDVIQYTVKAGNTVTIAFFCRQILLKNILFKAETKGNRLLI